MDRKTIIAKINDLEKKYPVDNWEINSIKIWPLLRIKLLYNLYEKIDKYPSKSHKPFMTLNNKVVLYLSYVFPIIEWIKFLIIPTKSVDFLFVAGKEHRSIYKGESYNRLFDPLIEYGITKGITYKYLDYSTYDQNYILNKKNLIIISAFLKLMPLFIKFYHSTNTVLVLKDFLKFKEEFYSIFNIDNSDSILEIKVLVKNIKEVEFYRYVFYKIFRKYKPKSVFTITYYNPLIMGLNLAAKKCNIATIDMQHGPQANIHAAYGLWGKIPSGGYETMPHFFWCWNTESAKSINKWNQQVLGPKVLIGGHPWIEKLQHQRLNPNLLEDRKIILLTLQPIGKEFVEPYIIDTIKQTPEEYVWWLRLHPRQMHDKDYFFDFLKRAQIFEKVDVKHASELPLPIILMNSSVNITKFSGTVLEANDLLTPSLIIDQNGVDSFYDLIDNHNVYVCLEKNSEVLLDKIKSITNRSLTLKEMPWSVDNNRSLKTFDRIITDKFL